MIKPPEVDDDAEAASRPSLKKEKGKKKGKKKKKKGDNDGDGNDEENGETSPKEDAPEDDASEDASSIGHHASLLPGRRASKLSDIGEEVIRVRFQVGGGESMRTN